MIVSSPILSAGLAGSNISIAPVAVGVAVTTAAPVLSRVVTRVITSGISPSGSLSFDSVTLPMITCGPGAVVSTRPVNASFVATGGVLPAGVLVSRTSILTVALSVLPPSSLMV